MTARKPRAATTPPTDDDPRADLTTESDRGGTPSSLSVGPLGDSTRLPVSPERIEVPAATEGDYVPPGPPEHLGDAGRSFWQAVTADNEFSEHLLPQLDQAAGVLDLCRALEETVEREGETYLDPRIGCSKPHPCAVELRHQRAIFSRLVVLLRIPDADGHTPQERSVRGAYGVTEVPSWA